MQNDAWASALRNEAGRETKRCASASAMAACAASNHPPALDEIWPDPTFVSSGTVRRAPASQPTEYTPPARALFNSPVIGPICTTGAAPAFGQLDSGSRQPGSAREKGEKGQSSASSAVFSSPSARHSTAKSSGKGTKDSDKNDRMAPGVNTDHPLPALLDHRPLMHRQPLLPLLHGLLLPPARLRGLPKDRFLSRVSDLEA